MVKYYYNKSFSYVNDWEITPNHTQNTIPYIAVVVYYYENMLSGGKEFVPNAR